MLDFVFLAVTALFFILAILYTHACERLKKESSDEPR